jgi:GMP synthase-like glutamine amidotransferase
MILVVDMNCRKDSLGFYEFVLPIVTIAQDLDEFVVVKHYAEIKQDHLGKCDLVILSGTPLRDHATLNQTEKFEWIKTCKKPILGICAGLQTLGLVFSLSLKNCLSIGMTQITVLKPNPLFSSTLKAYSLHNFSVVPSDEFEVLSETTQCVQAIKHRQKDIFGVLFHPEVRNREIIERFVHAFGHDRRV